MRSLAQVLSDENRALRPIAEAESYQIMASKNGARRLLRNNTGQRMGLKVSDLLETDQYRDAGRRRTRCDGCQGFGVLDLKSFADALRLGWCVETINGTGYGGVVSDSSAVGGQHPKAKTQVICVKGGTRNRKRTYSEFSGKLKSRYEIGGYCQGIGGTGD